MVGLLVWEDHGVTHVDAQVISLFGVSFYRVALSPRSLLLSYRLKKGAALLAQQGVRRLLVGDPFPHWSYFTPCGIRAVDGLSTLQGLAGDILLSRFQQEEIAPHTASVALDFPRVDPTLTQVAIQLAPHVAHLVLPKEGGGVRLQEKLFHQFGLAPCPSLRHPTATLIFSQKPPQIQGISLQFHQVQGSGFSHLSLQDEELPEDFPPLPTLSLLLQRGAVKKSQLKYT